MATTPLRSAWSLRRAVSRPGRLLCAAVAAVAIGSSPIVSLPGAAPAAAAAGAVGSCSATDVATDPVLASLRAVVYRADDLSTPVFAVNADTTSAQASVMKISTSVVARAVLGDDFRFTTTVYAGKARGTIVIAGTGDPTLSRSGRSVYAGAPSMTTLAAAVKKWSVATKTRVTRIVVDTRAYDATTLTGPWDTADIRAGYVSRISALMVDGDRAVPTSRTSPRSNAPAAKAATAFRNAVFAAVGSAKTPSSVAVTKKTKISIAYGRAAQKSTIATVSSQPLRILLGQMLPYSDNTLAEALAIRATKAVTGVASYARLDAAYHSVLGGLGIDAAGMTFRDGSGMSEKNRLSAAYDARLIARVTQDAAQASILSALPVVGRSGTLGGSGRFATSKSYSAKRNAQLAAARLSGAIVGKDGYLTGLLSLAGTMVAADGTRLVFSVTSIDPKFGTSGRITKRYAKTQPWVDYLVARIYACGGSLLPYGA